MRNAVRFIPIFLAGMLFAGGLALSGMINPEKVVNFLDIFGTWDPSLAFVLGGAVIVAGTGYRFVLKQGRPMFEASFSIPGRTEIDRDLVLGAALFGIGWGMVGLCPGPAIAALPVAPLKAPIFVAGMIGGMVLARMRKSGGRLISPRVKGSQGHEKL